MKNPRVWTNDEYVEIANPTDIDKIKEALRFKAEHIKAKAEPEVFEIAAIAIDGLFEIAYYWKRKADELSRAKDEDDLK